MSGTELQLRHRRVGNDGKVELAVWQGDEALTTDRFCLTSSRAREAFVDKLCKEYPGIDRAELEAKLTRLAADLIATEQANQRQALQGTALDIAPPEPWPQPVRLAAVLSEFADLLRTHVVMGINETVVCALWTAFTHAVDSFDVAGYLIVQSAVKRCGKTTLSRIIAAAACKALYAASVAPAALFRTIEATKPTFILDECDAYLAGNEELRGLLNAGVTHDEAHVVRCVGDGHEPRKFSVFGPKLLAGIGRLPPTVEDRAFIVRLQRRAKDEHIKRLTRAALAHAKELGRQFYRWYLDNRGEIQADAEPPIPENLSDRQADIWRPLLLLADLAGGPWPGFARQAAVALSAEGADTDELPIRFLADAAALEGRDEVTAAELAEMLGQDIESPWATYARGRPISAHQTGRLLGSFGIKHRKRHGRRTYKVEDILAAAHRYCADTGEVNAPNAPIDVSPSATMTYEGALGPSGGTKAEANAPHLSPSATTSYDEWALGGIKCRGVCGENRNEGFVQRLLEDLGQL